MSRLQSLRVNQGRALASRRSEIAMSRTESLHLDQTRAKALPETRQLRIPLMASRVRKPTAQGVYLLKLGVRTVPVSPSNFNNSQTLGLWRQKNLKVWHGSDAHVCETWQARWCSSPFDCCSDIPSQVDGWFVLTIERAGMGTKVLPLVASLYPRTYSLRGVRKVRSVRTLGMHSKL